MSVSKSWPAEMPKMPLVSTVLCFQKQYLPKLPILQFAARVQSKTHYLSRTFYKNRLCFFRRTVDSEIFANTAIQFDPYLEFQIVDSILMPSIKISISRVPFQKDYWKKIRYCSSFRRNPHKRKAAKSHYNWYIPIFKLLNLLPQYRPHSFQISLSQQTLFRHINTICK